MGPRVLGLTQNAYFSPSKHTKQFLFVTFGDTPSGMDASFWMDGEGVNETQTGQLKYLFRFPDPKTLNIQCFILMNACTSFFLSQEFQRKILQQENQ